MKLKICEFRAKNIPENDLTYVEVEEENGVFFYINYFASSWHGNECVFGLLILSVIWIMGRKCYCIICN